MTTRFVVCKMQKMDYLVIVVRVRRACGPKASVRAEGQQRPPSTSDVRCARSPKASNARHQLLKCGACVARRPATRAINFSGVRPACGPKANNASQQFNVDRCVQSSCISHE